MKKMRHKNVVKLLGICTKPSLGLVMEFLPQGNLFDFLQNARQQAVASDPGAGATGEIITWRTKMRLMLDCARGLQFLHSQRPQILHRDMKSVNVLLVGSERADDMLAKICDFGTCVAAYIYVGRVVTNPLWLSPEIIRGLQYSAKSDIYSLGMVFYEVHMAQPPFEEYGWRFACRLERQIVEGLRPTIPVTTTPTSLTELIVDCWADDPDRRPSADEIVQRLEQIEPEVSQLPFGWRNEFVVQAQEPKVETAKYVNDVSKTYSLDINQKEKPKRWKKSKLKKATTREQDRDTL